MKNAHTIRSIRSKHGTQRVISLNMRICRVDSELNLKRVKIHSVNSVNSVNFSPVIIRLDFLLKPQMKSERIEPSKLSATYQLYKGSVSM